MSDASTRARKLLAKATPGRWEPLMIPDDGYGREAWFVRGVADMSSERAEADAALIAEACSPDGGLLATLAAEVERLEAGPVGACQRCGATGVKVWFVHKKEPPARLPLVFAVWCDACLEANRVALADGRHLTDGIDALLAEVARLRVVPCLPQQHDEQ